jgi:hypothetical protein
MQEVIVQQQMKRPEEMVQHMEEMVDRMVGIEINRHNQIHRLITEGLEAHEFTEGRDRFKNWHSPN